MPPFTTLSTFNATSSPDRRYEPFEPTRQRSGKLPSPLHEASFILAHFAISSLP
jgi:hypothetical protein